MGRGTLKSLAIPALRVFGVTPDLPETPAAVDSVRHPRSLEMFYQFALLGMVQFGFAALNGSGYLDVISSDICYGILLVRFLMVLGLVRTGLSGMGLLIGCLIAVVAAAVDFVLVSRFLPATAIHFTLLLAGLRIISARSDRDCFHVQIISLVALVLGGILAPGPKFAIYLAGFLICSIASMISSEMRVAWRYPGAVVGVGKLALARRLAAMTAAVSLAVLLTGAGLFFVLPRTQKDANWDRRGGASYFAESVGLDDIGSIKRREKPVLHVRMLSAFAPQIQYWRGSALTLFDGKHWFNPGHSPSQEAPAESRPMAVGPRGPAQAPRFHYEVEYQELISNLLFLADRPEYVAVDAERLIQGPGDAVRMVRKPTTKGYVGYSYLPSALPATMPLSDQDRILYTVLPAPHPGVRQLAVEYTRGAVGPEQEARAIEFRLRRDFAYTLELPKRVPSDPIAHFLLERKRGHCEYFASAMAVLLRLRGIPARVAVGFLAPQRPLVNGWSVVRASDAHSWVEAWLPEKGWTTFDPTPPDPSGGSTRFDQELGRLRDAAELFWNRWIADYDLRRQVTLALEMHRSGQKTGSAWLDRLADFINWFAENKMAGLIRFLPVIALLFVVALFLGWRMVRKRLFAMLRFRKIKKGSGAAHDATLLYEQMLVVLEKRGVEKPAWLTPVEFVRIVKVPELATVMNEFTDAYNEMRFGGNPKVAPKMVALIDQVKRSPARVTRGPER